jgi:hypothetical protein
MGVACLGGSVHEGSKGSKGRRMLADSKWLPEWGVKMPLFTPDNVEKSRCHPWNPVPRQQQKPSGVNNRNVT